MTSESKLTTQRILLVTRTEQQSCGPAADAVAAKEAAEEAANEKRDADKAEQDELDKARADAEAAANRAKEAFNS